MWEVRAVTPRDALARACIEARRFRYIPDTTSTDLLTRLLEDVWDTVAEFEAREGGDCDGWSLWSIERAHALAPGPHYAFVVGSVRQQGQWFGHAWVALLDTDEWADPTWGWGPTSPASLGWPSTRQPQMRWRFDGMAFPVQEEYPR